MKYLFIFLLMMTAGCESNTGLIRDAFGKINDNRFEIDMVEHRVRAEARLNNIRTERQDKQIEALSRQVAKYLAIENGYDEVCAAIASSHNGSPNFGVTYNGDIALYEPFCEVLPSSEVGPVLTFSKTEMDLFQLGKSDCKERCL